MDYASKGVRAHKTATESRGTSSEVVGAHLDTPPMEPSARDSMGISPEGVQANPDTPPKESSVRELMGISPKVVRLAEENEGIFSAEMEEINYMETETQDAEW